MSDDSDIMPIVLIFGIAGAGLAYWFWQRSNAAAQPGATTPAPGAGSEPQLYPPAYYPAPMPPMPTPAPIGGGARSVSAAGKQNIKNREGLRLTAYVDGPGHSIGYGHFIQPGEVFNGPISIGRANQLFASDIAHVEHIINAQVRVPLSQNRYDALADLVFNAGHIPAAMLSQLNAGNYAAAGADFTTTSTLPGVIARREADANLWAAG